MKPDQAKQLADELREEKQTAALARGLKFLPSEMEKQGRRLHTLKIVYRYVDWLAVLSVRQGETWEIAFHAGNEATSALIGIIERARQGTLKWKPDDYKNAK